MKCGQYLSQYCICCGTLGNAGSVGLIMSCDIILPNNVTTIFTCQLIISLEHWKVKSVLKHSITHAMSKNHKYNCHIFFQVNSFAAFMIDCEMDLEQKYKGKQYRGNYRGKLAPAQPVWNGLGTKIKYN